MLRVCVALAATISVAGCAHDNYTVIPGGPGTQAGLKSTLQFCKDKILHEYASGQSHLGAVLFGAAGALADADSGRMKADDIDPAIERCMKERGYDGTSEN